MTRWEYATIKIDSEFSLLGGRVDTTKLVEALNQAGSDGWELVSTVETTMGEGRTRCIIMMMKRPLARA